MLVPLLNPPVIGSIAAVWSSLTLPSAMRSPVVLATPLWARTPASSWAQQRGAPLCPHIATAASQNVRPDLRTNTLSASSAGHLVGATAALKTSVDLKVKVAPDF